MPKVTSEHKQQRRQQVLKAAAEVFSHKGYEGATLKDIVEAAGMSRGWIYMYFPDKQAIMRALLDDSDEGQSTALDRLVQQHGTVSGALTALLQLRAQNLARPEPGIEPAVYEFGLAGLRDPQIRAYFAERYDRSLRRFTSFLERGITGGEFRPKLPAAAIASHMIMSLDGLLTHTIALGAERVDITGHIRLIHADVLQLLGVADTASSNTEGALS